MKGDENMKIIQIIPLFSYGGAETMCTNLSIELKKLGHDVIVISLYSKKTHISKYIEKNGIKVIYLDKKEGLDLSIFKKLKIIFKKFKPDVVHSHLYASKYAHIPAYLTKVKCKIHTIHNVANKESGFINQKINSFLFKYLNVIPVSLSNIVHETVVNTYGISLENSPVILNGVPLDKCHKHKHYNTPPQKFVHIGRFSEQKNHLMLVKAFIKAHERINNIELFLYGEGELEVKVKECVKNYKAESYIHFCGVTNDPYTALNSADCFILPSKWEGIPMTLIEAMGTGLPIIATKVGGIENMLKDKESGILINVNEEEIVNAIKKIHDDVDLYKSIGKNALSESFQFSSINMAKEYIKIYQKDK